jgi:cell division protein FtsW
MARTLKSDRWLFLATMLLVGISVVMVYSASAVQAAENTRVPMYFAPWFKQLVAAMLGVGLLFVVVRVDYHTFKRPAVIWSLLAVVAALLLVVFFFPPRNGTQRWIAVGGLSLQPSELAKLATILFAAALLERRMHRVNEPAYALLPIALVTLGLAGLVVKEPDLGTTVMIVFTVTAMVFAAGLSYRYVFGVGMLFLTAMMAVTLMFPYQQKRLMTFMDPWRDQLGDGFQITQSLMAVGSGGVLGRGLMHGVQKLYYLPEAHNDFIYAVVAEELGLWGTTVMLLLFGFIAWRGLRIALAAPDRFGALLAIGITCMVAVQALVNMSVVLAMVPTKGIPLPLVSNGGSSLLINIFAVGILLNISQQSSAVAT